MTDFRCPTLIDLTMMIRGFNQGKNLVERITRATEKADADSAVRNKTAGLDERDIFRLSLALGGSEQVDRPLVGVRDYILETQGKIDEASVEVYRTELIAHIQLCPSCNQSYQRIMRA